MKSLSNRSREDLISILELQEVSVATLDDDGELSSDTSDIVVLSEIQALKLGEQEIEDLRDRVKKRYVLVCPSEFGARNLVEEDCDHVKFLVQRPDANEQTQIKALDKGVDDYVQQTDTPLSVMTRLRRKTDRMTAPVIKVEGFKFLVYEDRFITPKGVEMDMRIARKERLCLIELLRAYPGGVLRDDLREKVWPNRSEDADPDIDSKTIARLRKSLDNLGLPFSIPHGARGSGFKLVKKAEGID